MNRNLSYFWSLTPQLVCILGNFVGGWFTLGNVLYTLIVLGIVEIISPSNTSNRHQKETAIPKIILYLHILLQILVAISWIMLLARDASSWECICGAICAGIAGGSGAIVVAHELIHKANKTDQFWGKFLLASVGNVSFFVHHLRIHHRWVGTSKDAATAKMNQNYYAYLSATFISQFLQAWNSESAILKNKGKSAWSGMNFIFQQIILQSFIGLVLLHFFGVFGIFLWLLSNSISRILLEYVNYIEHYGLQKDESEKVNELHSWQCDKVVSRFFLIDLSRHSDHHMHANKPFNMLNSHLNSPVLPGGYASLIIPVLIPPLWKKLTHPILKKIL